MCCGVSVCFIQVKYKDSVSDSLYATLPETLDTQHAKHATAIISEVQQPRVQTLCDFCTLQTLSHSRRARDHHVLYVQVKYKEGGRQSLSSPLFTRLPETLQTQTAREIADAQSDVSTSSLHRALDVSRGFCLCCFYSLKLMCVLS